jgi:hypothetical protein
LADLSRLRPEFRQYADLLLRIIRRHGPYVVTSAYRSPAEQQALWNRYQRGEPGLFTVAPPGRVIW